MVYTPLAYPSDVEAILGRDLTSDEGARVDAILAKASELFREGAQQTFTADRSQVRLKVNGGKVYLPQRPVVEIYSVTDDDGNDVAYKRFQQWLTVPLASDRFVIVEYEHGATAPPAMVTLCVAEVAKKVLSIAPQATAGVTQSSRTSGPFSESQTYATWAVGGQTMLAPDDKAIAESFRVRIPNVTIMQP